MNSVTFIQDQQVYIVRTEKGLWALSAVCTHLGCITQWKPDANRSPAPATEANFRRTETWKSRARAPAAAALFADVDGGRSAGGRQARNGQGNRDL